ncbi:S-formylglutathione hydrolase FrmB [Parafrankia irregularis]|uniref:S-formylglutathione hydrolase FrmB n=1 Tax=Parafrankia irregularis TaxID=795642 RepID=A0A0S4QHS1_9ACTN|nr:MULTISPECIES: alpha/beta hydrolase family protein [Parafrankia]CUU54750.1 S-formylglutathione hydrolase FrmB [Parafrankia irregularis]
MRHPDGTGASGRRSGGGRLGIPTRLLAGFLVLAAGGLALGLPAVGPAGQTGPGAETVALSTRASTTRVSAASLAARVPGSAVAPLTQVNRSVNGGLNTLTNLVPATATLGVPNAGTVPVVGSVAAMADDGAYVAYESRVDDRTVDLMIVSPALNGAAPVRVILPAGWAGSPAQTWPSLYLIHGCCEKADYQSWSVFTNIRSFAADKQALVVMPSDGSAGFGTNWLNIGVLRKGWGYDTFLATELPQILQRGYRASGRAAIAGASVGGYAAFALSALHPGAYGAAASYSGVLDSIGFLSSGLIQGLLVREGQLSWAMWGDPVLFLAVWARRNPADLITRLRGINLYVSSGNGTPGPLDYAGADSDPFEMATNNNGQAFMRAANAGRLPVVTDFYGNGTHSWKYWDRQLVRSWPTLAAGLGLPAA